MARDVRSITGRGFQIVLSRSFVGEVFPFISALEVLVPIYKKCADVPIRKNFKRRNEEEDFSYSGFHLDPELASRDKGAPQEGRTRGGSRGRGDRGSFLFLSPPKAATNCKPFSEYKNIGFYDSGGAAISNLGTELRYLLA